jgi:adenosylhomocysteine nucleosidase
VTGILGAFPEETRILIEHTTNKQTVTVFGIEFVTGELEGRQVVIALTGVGKVNSAMTTTVLLLHFQPAQVIFTGIAGGLNPALRPGDIVIADKLAQHDFGVITADGFRSGGTPNPINAKRNPMLIPADAQLVVLAQHVAADITLDPLRVDGEDRAPAIVTGTVVTGDVFVASDAKRASLAENFAADAVEMEGAAVAQVCYQQGVPFIVLRSLSDNADQRAHEDLERFCKTAASNSARLTMALMRALTQRERDETARAPASQPAMEP